MVLVRGASVRPHVQTFADACSEATGAGNFGTYPGHSPSIDRALDIFVPNRTTKLGDAIADFTLKNWERYGVRYIIWRQRINWNDGAGWSWMEDRGDDTQNHFDHNHVSFELTAVGQPPTQEKLFMDGENLANLSGTCGLVMDLAIATATKRGGQALMWSVNGGSNQRMTFEPISGMPGLVKIRFGSNPKMVLDNDPASTVVHMIEDLNVPQQRWRLVELHNGAILVRNEGTERVLDVHGGVATLGQWVHAWHEEHRQANQLWRRIKVG